MSFLTLNYFYLKLKKIEDVRLIGDYTRGAYEKKFQVLVKLRRHILLIFHRFSYFSVRIDYTSAKLFSANQLALFL